MSNLRSRKKGVIQYEENPFLSDLDIPLKKRFDRQEAGVFITDKNMMNGNGEASEVAEITRVKMIDETKFVKLYTDELRSFFALKPSTQKVLQVVLVELQKRKDKDLVYLNYKHACEYFTSTEGKEKPIMTRPTFQSALKEMIDKDFIAESTYQNQYFINPKLFFNGDRVRLVREYRRVKSTENQLDLLEDS